MFDDKISLLPLSKKITLNCNWGPQLTCLSREYFLGLTKYNVHLCSTMPRLLTEHGYQQSNPSLERQRAGVSWLSNQAPLRASVSIYGQSHWTNHQGIILLHLDTTSNTYPKERWVNHLKGANKEYFTILSTNSVLLNSRHSLHGCWRLKFPR